MIQRGTFFVAIVETYLTGDNWDEKNFLIKSIPNISYLKSLMAYNIFRFDYELFSGVYCLAFPASDILYAYDGHNIISYSASIYVLNQNYLIREIRSYL